MKKRSLNIALFSLVFACASCNKITESIQQDIVVNDTVYFNIPILDSINNTTISGIPLVVDLEKEINSGPNKFTIDQIKSTKIKSLIMGLSPIIKDSIDTKNNFGNLQSIRFRIAADGGLGNIANTTIVSSGTSSAIALTPSISPDSLRSFLINPLKTYNVIVKAKKPTTTLLKVGAAITYTITLSK